MSRKPKTPRFEGATDSNLIRAEIKFITYNGDVRHMVGEVKGYAGRELSVVSAEYDEKTNKTRVGFANLADILKERR